MSRRWNAVIVGGGLDGLVCAAVLARAGRGVLLLARRPSVGGSSVTEEIAPGFRAPAVGFTASRLRPALVRALDLDRHGLSLVPLRSAWAPSPEGPGICRWADPARTREEIAQVDVRDADRYPALVRRVAELAVAAGPILDREVPDPSSLRPGDLARMATFAFALVRAGHLAPLLAIATQSVADWLAEWLDSEVVRAPIVAAALQDAFLGPRTAGTALNLLRGSLGSLGPSGGGRCIAIGGNGAVSDAVARAARAAGAEIRTGVAVDRVRVQGDQATGVVLQGGEEIDAEVVVVAEERQDGGAARINLALDHLPAFAGRPGTEHLAGEITIAPNLTAIDEAYTDARVGRWSRRPMLHLTIPTLSDPTLASPGRHVMTILVRYAPHALAGGPGRWAEEREPFADHVLSVVDELCPGLTKSVVQRQVLTPVDLERIHGLRVNDAPEDAVSGLWRCSGDPLDGTLGGSGARCAERLLAAGAS